MKACPDAHASGQVKTYAKAPPSKFFPPPKQTTVGNTKFFKKIKIKSKPFEISAVS